MSRIGIIMSFVSCVLERVWRRRLLTLIARADTPERYVDAPISLQLVGRRYEDEKVIEALEMITEAAGLPFSKAGSSTVASKL
jgi:hypothetical protein